LAKGASGVTVSLAIVRNQETRGGRFCPSVPHRDRGPIDGPPPVRGRPVFQDGLLPLHWLEPVDPVAAGSSPAPAERRRPDREGVVTGEGDQESPGWRERHLFPAFASGRV